MSPWCATLAPQLSTHTMVENYPVKTPMLDVVAVGAGGGSLAWIDPYGALKVGPQSAGADPGPICYARGGTEPTVTDAGVVLGRLPEAFIGGGLTLDVGSARRAFETLGQRLGLTAEDAAAGVLEIAASNQVQGIRTVTTTRGLDPGDYAMIAFGGAGGLFAADVADFLGIRVALSPPNPGNLSAFGLHVSDIRRDYVRTLVRQQSTASAEELDELWGELERQGRDEIGTEGRGARRYRAPAQRRRSLCRRRTRGARDDPRPTFPAPMPWTTCGRHFMACTRRRLASTIGDDRTSRW